MKFVEVFRMRSREKIAEFLGSEHVGRIATVDADGYPQVIPMNFVFLDGSIYMHSHTRGEKLDNIARDAKVGFEVDREFEFLPSYFSDPRNASLADTLYVSVVVKGTASIVSDRDEKARALNGLMEKYQPEGGYEAIRPEMKVLNAVSVIKVEPVVLHGKYKIGQHMRQEAREDLAKKILARGTPTAAETLRIMGFETDGDSVRMTDQPSW